MTLYERTDEYLYLLFITLSYNNGDHLKNLISWSKRFLHYLFRATLRNLEPKTILKSLKFMNTRYNFIHELDDSNNTHSITIKLQGHVK